MKNFFGKLVLISKNKKRNPSNADDGLWGNPFGHALEKHKKNTGKVEMQETLILPVWNETDYLFWLKVTDILKKCERKSEWGWYIYEADRVLMPEPNEFNSEETLKIFSYFNFDKVVPVTVQPKQAKTKSSGNIDILDFLHKNNRSGYDGFDESAWTQDTFDISDYIEGERISRHYGDHFASDSSQKIKPVQNERNILPYHCDVRYQELTNTVTGLDGMYGQILAGKDGKVLYAMVNGLTLGGVHYTLKEIPLMITKFKNKELPFHWGDDLKQWIADNYLPDVKAFKGEVAETTLYLG